ncbi:MAG TPA: 16S rRNA (cytosine(967)-C(5))-methyltransferase RsmB [Candidatus Gastranaerophilales bacterium]|nr:16S rRNA (cytosine(967)-C(5))-methyltransferase RsmB [Candidatus Gastranaerophilales bacterium]
MDVRHAALKCLIKTLEHQNFYEESFKQYAHEVNSPSELKNTLSGAIKFKLALDFYVEKISSKKISKLSPEIRNILRLGIFELEFLKAPEYAVVNSYVELCGKLDKKSTGFVNAVLRNFIRKRADISINENDLGEIKYISIKYSHPEWLVKRWIGFYGREETEKICAYNNMPSKINLRINSLKTGRENLLKLFEEKNIKFEESLFSKNCIIVKESGNIKSIPGFEEGLWVVQGESSSLVAEILAPEQDDKVLDFCAAPGGKTTHIAALMKDKGKIIAVDISSDRIKRINQNCKRLDINSIHTVVGNAEELKFKEPFDKILIDSPCSNTGVFAARPDARWQKNSKDIEKLCELQMKILKNAACQLKSGGILVYSTCSIEHEENEGLINRFLQENEDFKPESFKLGSAFENAECSGMLQILQSRYQIDGFFIAKLKKL